MEVRLALGNALQGEAGATGTTTVNILPKLPAQRIVDKKVIRRERRLHQSLNRKLGQSESGEVVEVAHSCRLRQSPHSRNRRCHRIRREQRLPHPAESKRRNAPLKSKSSKVKLKQEQEQKLKQEIRRKPSMTTEYHGKREWERLRPRQPPRRVVHGRLGGGKGHRRSGLAATTATTAAAAAARAGRKALGGIKARNLMKPLLPLGDPLAGQISGRKIRDGPGKQMTPGRKDEGHGVASQSVLDTPCYFSCTMCTGTCMRPS
mmetsp:Transcript_1814/g.4112  ORF Transcript_1814/g.4112 Transcript_1814/m.4112 type:complete len:262 (-) Transcript_1814:94-879(-)